MRNRSHRLFTSALVAAALLVPAAARADAPDLTRLSALVAHGDYAGAQTELEALGPAAKSPAALLLRARVELETGRYDDAAATAKAASEGGKQDKLAATPIRAEALARRGKVDDAIRLLRDVAREDDALRARLLLGELLIRAGKRGEARAPLMTLIDDYNSDKITGADALGLSMVGRAAHLLRSARDANDAYNAAEKVGGKERVETLLWRSELYLDKYDPAHAAAVVKEALKLAPKAPEAHVAMARVTLESAMDFDAAESEIKQALAVNPNLAPAYAVRAGLALRDMDLAAADAALDRGLSVDPTDLELLAMKAATRFLADDPQGFEAVKQKVLALDAEDSEFYRVVSEFAEWEHRYDDIVKMMREAVAIDKQDAKAYATLGLNLIRSGDETGGLDALRTAWTKDRFNVRVFNTLNLYEKTIATQYVTASGQTFQIRYQKDEKAVLERYVPRMLDEAWASMVSRYGFTPSVPVSIELYADPEHFSVRTSGLPNVGIQGVCFGKTLAAMSPGAGEFNWGNVLWHELAHVFAIQLSKSHVPRWFTEGLSEYETIVRRPEWQREEDPALYAALRAGRVPAVESFNRAFTHVDDVSDVTMAYYAASQILVFASQDFGFDKVVSMLPRWGRGERTAEVVQGALSVSTGELDRRYRAWLTGKLGRYDKQFVPDMHAPPLDDARKAALASPKDAKKQVSLALALLEDKQMPEGEATLDEALRLDPKQPDALFVKLRMALAKKDLAGAQKLADGLITGGHGGYAVRMKAADIAEMQKDDKRLRAHLEAASTLDPTMAEPLQALYDIAHEAKDKAGELSALRRLARVDQHSRRAYVALLALLIEQGQWEEARKVGESALFIDVMNPEVHRLYARALARTGRFVSAVYELNSALACKPKDPAEIYGELAKAYDRLGMKDEAGRAREYQQEAAPQGRPEGRPPAPDDGDGT